MSELKENPVDMVVKVNHNLEMSDHERKQVKVKAMLLMSSVRGESGMCVNLLSLILGGNKGYGEVISIMESSPED